MSQMPLPVKRLLSYLPTRLPLGMAEFETWSNTIVSLLGPGLEKVPTDDVKFVLSTILQRIAPDEHRRSMQYFVRSLRSAATKQVAAQAFQDIKQKQADALAKQKQAEDTAKLETTTSEQEAPQ